MDYVTEEEIRSYCGIASQEYPSEFVMALASMSMDELDHRTGRTWRGPTSVTEYYTGDGSDTLFLNHVDIIQLESLSIDDDNDGNYTNVSVDKVKVYNDEGILVLRNNAEVNIFPRYDNSILVTYTYGLASSSTIPNDIKLLCLKIIANMIHPNDMLSKDIDRDIKSHGALGSRLI